MEGSHSPFGLIWQVANATGWSVKYITRRISYPLLLLMIADTPKLVKGNPKVEEQGRKRGSAMSIFQTMLSKK